MGASSAQQSNTDQQMSFRNLPDPSTPLGERVRRRLRENRSSGSPRSGTTAPTANPVGFLLQDDNSILIYNMANANRISHVVDRPQVALHFDGDGTGGDIGSAEEFGKTFPVLLRIAIIRTRGF